MPVHLPAALVAFRALVSPLLVWDAWNGMVTGWFLAVFIAAFLSDVLGGMIARRLGVSTSRLRYADTWADIALYLAVLVSAWLTHRETLLALGWPFTLLLASTAASWGVDLLKYGRLSSYHPWSAKAWGVTLAIAIVALFGWNYTGWAMWLMIGVGVLSNLECIAMSLTLPRWTHDVPSIVHALERRAVIEP
ncbi:MAG TPA: CDP-alcohol phosphatidyltransferase family protein [Methylomirabilota bacterium]|nr:CDP-alcohol phosphatidyltransferase family protein [Methylomirabilota bacterium]